MQTSNEFTRINRNKNLRNSYQGIKGTEKHEALKYKKDNTKKWYLTLTLSGHSWIMISKKKQDVVWIIVKKNRAVKEKRPFSKKILNFKYLVRDRLYFVGVSCNICLYKHNMSTFC